MSSSGVKFSSPRGCAFMVVGDKGGDPSGDVGSDRPLDLVDVAPSKSSSGTCPSTAAAAGLCHVSLASHEFSTASYTS
jgi:hypothetical protein